MIKTCVDGGEPLILPSFAAIGVRPLVDRFADFALHGFSGLSQLVDHTLQKKKKQHEKPKLDKIICTSILSISTFISQNGKNNLFLL